MRLGQVSSAASITVRMVSVLHRQCMCVKTLEAAPRDYCRNAMQVHCDDPHHRQALDADDILCADEGGCCRCVQAVRLICLCQCGHATLAPSSHVDAAVAVPETCGGVSCALCKRTRCLLASCLPCGCMPTQQPGKAHVCHSPDLPDPELSEKC